MTKKVLLHTPAPWKVYGFGLHEGLYVGAGADGIICDLYQIYQGTLTEYENSDANANLIAAAPDLLKACEAAKSVLECRAIFVNEAKRRIDKALVKAYGEV
jgi:hypothetical protein